MRQPASRFPAAALILLAVASSNCARAAELPPRGVLLRQGVWRGDVGTYHLLEAWMSLPTKRWPMDGWGVPNVDAAPATLTVSTLSPAAARERFRPVTEQLDLVRRPDARINVMTPWATPPDTENER